MSTREQIVGLLKNSKNGLDIIEISTQLKADIKDIQRDLIELQNSHQIVSGMRKYNAQHSGQPTFFDRVYAVSSR